MNHSLKLGKIAGIEIDLHYTWFIIIALLAWSLAVEFFPANYPDLTLHQYWIIGIISAIMLFVSVLLHELSHSLVAKKSKIPVGGITLFFFGGVSEIEADDVSPKKEFTMAIAGPIASLLLAGIFFLISKNLLNLYINAVSFYLMRLNLILALFNLVPGFPLDGGRVLRAAIWYFSGDIKKATRYAANAGKLFAFLLIGAGITGIFLGMGTLWFVLIGMFLYFLAGMSYEQLIVHEILVKAKIKDIMHKDMLSVSPSLKVSDLFSKFLSTGKESILVIKDHKLQGIVNTDCLKKAPKQKWAKLAVKDIMVKEVFSVKPESSAFKALSQMNTQQIDMLPVLKNNKLVGIVDLHSIVRYLRLKAISE